jgi:hypothetical protein
MQAQNVLQNSSKASTGVEWYPQMGERDSSVPRLLVRCPAYFFWTAISIHAHLRIAALTDQPAEIRVCIWAVSCCRDIGACFRK